MKAWQALSVIVLSLATSVARGETIEISGDYGGLLVAYQAKWKALSEKKDVNVRISGPCVSACTVLAGYIRREKICVTPSGSLGFHLGFPAFITPDLWKDYPTDIQVWISKKGGLSYQLLWLQAPEIYRFFHKC
ncbi:MAG TPA: hypothetical protein VK430_02695 [Xanthobacteraceae bacterium]|nr:hypothetical protein [Xanthobacteraceae bacterium]